MVISFPNVYVHAVPAHAVVSLAYRWKFVQKLDRLAATLMQGVQSDQNRYDHGLQDGLGSGTVVAAFESLTFTISSECHMSKVLPRKLTTQFLASCSLASHKRYRYSLTCYKPCLPPIL